MKIDFKSNDITDNDGTKWTRIEAKNKSVDIKQPYTIADLSAAIKLLEFKIKCPHN